MDITIAFRLYTKWAKDIKGLSDSGANGIFIERKWAEDNRIHMVKLDRVFNVDGTKNQAGDITHTADIKVTYQGHSEMVRAEVTEIGSTLLITRTSNIL